MILDSSFQYSVVRFTDWEASTMAIPALKCWAIFRRPLCGLESVDFNRRIYQRNHFMRATSTYIFSHLLLTLCYAVMLVLVLSNGVELRARSRILCPRVAGALIYSHLCTQPTQSLSGSARLATAQWRPVSPYPFLDIEQQANG